MNEGTKKKPRRVAKKPIAEQALPMPGMEEFKTRERANTGHKIPLFTAGGVLTAHWVRVRGIDSDAFQRARTKQTRRIAEIVELKEGEREEAVADATLEMLASLVAEWSFPEPCEHDASKYFLRDGPQIATAIDKLSSRRAFFFQTPADSLMPTQPNS